MADGSAFDMRAFIEEHAAVVRPLQPRRWELRSRWVQRRALRGMFGRREARRLLGLLRQPPECTGISAQWCPIHGSCTCPDREVFGAMDDEGCPLHSSASRHAE